ncbi:hypothetical protein G3576_13225 [Roseomonas stagni]|uniref:Uncharacterized protein n=1 Tax=Falsiroseomonas algicola TaxID=2716930 RepID=A0A6M1LLU0_9PROT|nr:hypothetical protein [Falsiroseomonas algicola]NGM20979.1 hypothetical protein [Falsiroseomonas algicola]
MTTGPRGMLAIWSDVAPEAATDYLHWLTREHTEERVSTPGFVGVRVLQAGIPGTNRFLMLYDLASPAVVGSAAYLARLNAPTPWTRRIMAGVTNVARGGGAVVAEAGRGQGSCVMALRLDEPPRPDQDSLRSLIAGDRICAARLIEVDAAGTGVATAEKALRRGDGRFAGLLLLEGLNVPALEAALATNRPALAALGAADAEAVPHRVIFALTGAELASGAC